MIERLIRFLKGYVRIDIYNGNVERFLNMLSYRNICIWIFRIFPKAIFVNMKCANNRAREF